MRIGELSKLSGVSIRSLRYYEQQKLLTPMRLENGYREYSPFALEQVRTISFYLGLGLSTEEIAGFLHCVMKNKEAFCQDILPIYQNKLEEVDRQIALLSQIRSNLIDRIDSIHKEKQTTMPS